MLLFKIFVLITLTAFYLNVYFRYKLYRYTSLSQNRAPGSAQLTVFSASLFVPISIRYSNGMAEKLKKVSNRFLYLFYFLFLMTFLLMLYAYREQILMFVSPGEVK